MHHDQCEYGTFIFSFDFHLFWGKRLFALCNGCSIPYMYISTYRLVPYKSLFMLLAPPLGSTFPGKKNEGRITTQRKCIRKTNPPLEEVRKVQRESDRTQGDTRGNRGALPRWRAPVLCQSVLPPRHEFPLTTGTGPAVCLLDHTHLYKCQFDFHSTEIEGIITVVFCFGQPGCWCQPCC